MKRPGDYFGYPQCCQDEFQRVFDMPQSLVEAERTEFQKELYGTGFVPCPKCAYDLHYGLCTIKDLIKDRIAPEPFPYGGLSDDGFESFAVWLLRQRSKRCDSPLRSEYAHDVLNVRLRLPGSAL